METQENMEPLSLVEGVAAAEAIARTAEAAEKKLAAVTALRALGVRSVQEVGWLLPDNVAPRPRLLLTVQDADNRAVPFMPAGKVAMLVAPGGTGKTQCLVQLAVCVASGLPWLDSFAVPDPGPVLLVLGEEDMAEIHRRVRGTVDAMHAWGFAAQIEENLHVLSLCGRPAGLTDKNGDVTDFFNAVHGGLAASDIPWRLVILDPASRFLGPDAEKDNAAATRWIEAAERLTQLPSAPTILFAHHANKGALGGNTDQSAARGSSALTDGVRWQGNLERAVDDDGAGGKVASASRVILKVVKVNHCRQPPPLELVRDFAHGGFLRPATAAVVAHPGANGGTSSVGGDFRAARYDDL